MSDPDSQAQIAAARAYEQFFVPALFGEYAAAPEHRLTLPAAGW